MIIELEKKRDELEKEYNKNIKEVLANMAQNLGSDYDYLSQVAKRAMKNARASFRLDKLLKAHPAIQRLIIRYCFANLKGSTRTLTFKHVREIEDLILNRPVNSIVDLPKGVSVVKRKKYLSFSKTKKFDKRQTICYTLLKLNPLTLG